MLFQTLFPTLGAIDDRLAELDSYCNSSSHGRRVRSTEQRFSTFLKSLPHSPSILTACPNDIRKFLIWSDANGKTQVHKFNCSYIGQHGVFECACPTRLSANSVQNLIQLLSEIYVQLGFGKQWDAFQTNGNPAQSVLIKSYLKVIKEEQAKARVLPQQAKPMFMTKLRTVFAYIDRELGRKDLTLREKFVLVRDQAFFKLQFFSGDRANDVSNILSQDVKTLRDDSSFVYCHTFGKTLRGNNHTNVFVVRRCADRQICAIHGLEQYFKRADAWGIKLSNGFLFRPVTESGVVLNEPISFSAVYSRLTSYLTLLGIYEGETPHSLRAGCALTLSTANASIGADAVMQHVGWRSAQSLKYYCRSHLIRDATSTASMISEATSMSRETEAFFRDYGDFNHMKQAF